MNEKPQQFSSWLLLSGGLVPGLFLVYLDNFAFGGETSPIVIVAILFCFTTLSTTILGVRGWITAFAIWMLLPSTHLVKHVLGLSDTIQPNTYLSVTYLAVFTLVVAISGCAPGLLIRRLREK